MFKNLERVEGANKKNLPAMAIFADPVSTKNSS